MHIEKKTSSKRITNPFGKMQRPEPVNLSNPMGGDARYGEAMNDPDGGISVRPPPTYNENLGYPSISQNWNQPQSNPTGNPFGGRLGTGGIPNVYQPFAKVGVDMARRYLKITYSVQSTREWPRVEWEGCLAWWSSSISLTSLINT